MHRCIACVILLLAGTVALSAQDNPLFNDDPMQHRPLGMDVPEYIIRQPTGLPTTESRVEPPNWWVGMNNPRVEVLIYDRNVARYDAADTDYPGVTVEYVRRLANPNYAFVGLHVAPGTAPGQVPLVLSRSSGGDADDRLTISYPLQRRPERDASVAPFSSRDLMYLIMPDRFANGDVLNDKVYAMADTLVNRDKLLFRHGGDLQGVIDHLDYLEDLGVTALWLNPVLENDQPYASYHGYAVSDHYRIDRRYGTNELYRELVRKAHARGMKVVMDVIFNHVGDQHYQIRDLPASDWIHQWPEYTKSNFRAATILDPNASEEDRKQMTAGWFDNHMPDLDQQNPHLATYLIQNSIWWTLYSGQDAFRIDTYTYPDTDFMAEWNRRLLAEFPDLGIFGETWVPHIGVQAWFVGGQKLGQEVDTHLPGVTDFQVHYAIFEALSDDPSWTGGVNRLWYTLAQDYMYPDPLKNVVFLDNHDISRMFSTFGGDLQKVKSALALLLTTRGIPCVYYGTEMALEGAGGAFGEGGRIDFPGGFSNDRIDLFDPEQRSALQTELHAYLRDLANYRKTSEALTVGKTTQFVPRDGIYVAFRRAGDEVVMTVFNGNSSARTLNDLAPYREMLGGFTYGRELTGDKGKVALQGMSLRAKEARVFRLQR